MIAQDATEIFLTITTYDAAYLQYLLGPPSQPVIPSCDVSTIPFFNIQEFGPFKLRVEKDLRLFAHIILALLLGQFQDTRAGSLVAAALQESDESIILT